MTGMHVVATAGHVDHGKSALVRALTGMEPDRWAEERRRGLTIDLGFAWTTLPSGRRLAVVDVPGHERFVGNMLAGVGSVPAALVVVAADDGWSAQTTEHVAVLDALGVRHALLAVTKSDLADPAPVLADAAARLERTSMGRVPAVAVSARTGAGVPVLVAALEDLLAGLPAPDPEAAVRLWIDRAFTIAGAGTVVTGTLAGGAVDVDDELVVEPLARPVRVRSIQRHTEQVTSIEPGNRTALNLVGVGHDDVRRGHVVVRPGQWHRTATVDASLTVLAALDHPVSRRGAYLAYVGSGEHPVRLRVLGPRVIEPGDTGAVRLHLTGPLPLTPGDRYVLRDAGRAETVGGGEVLDVDPVVRASRAAPDRSVDRVVAERGWIDARRLHLLTGEERAPDIGRWVVDPDRLAADRARLAARVAQAGPLGLDLATLDERDRAVAVGLDGVVVDAGRVVAAGAIDPLDDHPWLEALAAEPYTPPPPPPDIGRAEVRELVRRGAVVEVDGVAFAASAIDRAADVVRSLLEAQPDGVTVADIRDALGASRKFVLPLLAHLDATGRTRRRGDLRIAGPRL